MKVLLTTLNAKFSHSCLALRYLQMAGAGDGREIEIREYTINQAIDDILVDLLQDEPAVVGFACYIWNRREVLRLAAMVKQVFPRTLILIGGPEAACDYRQVAKMPGVDLVVCGEGEPVFPAVLQWLGEGADRTALAQISGLAFLDEQGEVLHTGWSVVGDLGELPTVYTEQSLAELQGRIIYYESSRGCPFRCQYCLSSLTQGVRYLPYERVREDLRLFDRAGVRQVKFVDRTFNASKEHYRPLVRQIAEQTGKTNYHFEVAADLFEEEDLRLFAELSPGRVQLEVGVQSTHAATLQAIQRTASWEKIKNNVAVLRQAGNIHLHLDLIAGLPQEDIVAFSRSFNDVYAVRPHMLQLGFLKLLPGSGVRQEAALHGYCFDAEPPYRVLSNRYLPFSSLRRLHFVEQVLELTYNAGRGLELLAWLEERFGGDAFAMYSALAIGWERAGFFRQAQGVGRIYEGLYDFAVRLWPEETELIAELLKWDIIGRERNQLRIPVLCWSPQGRETYGDFWRDEERVRRYLPEYQFSSWRDIQRQYVIERFSHDLSDGGRIRRPIIALFCLGDESVTWHFLQEADLVGREVEG